VATRRLREALPLVATGSRCRKLKKKARRLTRALGALRELDVALEMLRAFDDAREVPHAAVVCLRQSILEERRPLQADAVKAIDRWDGSKVLKKAGAGRRPSDQAGSARRRANRRAERLRAAIENAAGIYLPDRLHEVRIAVKKLRYVLEIGQPSNGARPAGRPRSRPSAAAAARVATLKRAQDTLGRMHDLEVLIARTRAVQGSPSAPNLRLSGDLDRLVRRLETECRQLHGHYMTLRASVLAICDDVTTAAQEAEPRSPAA
jgi:CHAD domain-containing protein